MCLRWVMALGHVTLASGATIKWDLSVCMGAEATGAHGRVSREMRQLD